MDPQEREPGIRVLYHDNFLSAGFHLAGTSFEAWLVEMCMSAWIAREVDPDAPDGRQTWKDLPTALVNYIVGICAEEGREALERGYLSMYAVSHPISSSHPMINWRIEFALAELAICRDQGKIGDECCACSCQLGVSESPTFSVTAVRWSS
jgi:hypothetical protein